MINAFILYDLFEHFRKIKQQTEMEALSTILNNYATAVPSIWRREPLSHMTSDGHFQKPLQLCFCGFGHYF